MQVTELEAQGLKKNFKIVVDSAQINALVETELRAAGESVKIPGFRPGYIPMKILQQRFGKSVQGDVLKKVINQTTTDVVTQKKLRPALTPQINIESYNDGGDLAYTMSVESFPDMPEIDFSKITLDRKTFEITEKDVDDAQARIAERNPSLVPAAANAKAALGNVLTIDFKGSVGGVLFDGGTAEGFDLELGSGQFIPGFEDQLVGTKKGDEKVVKVKFPDEYHSKELAGKDAEFAVTVQEIKVKEAGVIDDAFAKARGFENLEKIREAIRSQMTDEYNQLVRNHLKRELFDALEEKCDFELPESMVALEFKTIWERMTQAKAQGDDSTEGKSEEELKEEYMQIARRRVTLGLFLAEVGNVNKIQISREELTRAMIQQAKMFPGQEKMVMDYYRKNPERAEDLRGPILEEKAVDWVLGKVQYNDQKVSLEELAGEEDAEDGSESKKKKAAAPKKTAAKKKDAK